MPPVDIQWCDHSAVLIEYLRQLYDDGRFVDVGLECEGRQVKAHKAVISACSPYLEGLLKGNPARSHLIKFNGYSFKSLRSVIDFMYNGKVMIDQDQLAAFLKLGRALQVRGILDIASQCEEAGLTTPEETKSNAQYSTTVQQSQQKMAQQQRAQQQTDSKKYAFLVDKNTGAQGRKSNGSANYRKNSNIIGGLNHNKQAKITNGYNQEPQGSYICNGPMEANQNSSVLGLPPRIGDFIIGSVDQNTMNKTPAVQQNVPTTQSSDGALEELQQALVSGQALIQSDPNGGEQTLQMVEGQCVVTGSGQTYVVVQEGENLSFVPAEMVQGDLANVNGGQVMEPLENVEQQLAQMEGQVLAEGEQIMDAQGQAVVTQDTGTLETMSVVESLVGLGQGQPADSAEQPEIGADMPCLDADLAAATPQVGADMPDLLPPDQGVVTEETEDEATKSRASKRKAEGSPGDCWDPQKRQSTHSFNLHI